MSDEGFRFPRKLPRRLTGEETFIGANDGPELSVRDFWAWSASDLLSNATRGRLAEYIVARALNIPTCDVRNEWAACDLKLPDGSGVEVKSSAFLQSWAHRGLSRVTFSTRPTRPWDEETNRQEPVAARIAKVYVFALLKHLEKDTVDPLNLDQWEFYVLPTWALDERKRSQHSITLASLRREAGPAVMFRELAARVQSALAPR